MNYSKDNNKKELKKRESNKAKAKNKAGMLIIKILIGLCLVGAFAIVGAGVGAYIGIINSAEPISAINVAPDVFTSTIIDESTGETYATLEASENREYVKLEDISPSLQHAFIAIEDSRFYTNNGIDIRGIARSIYTTLKGNGSQGGSTITQQLIKNSRNLLKNSVETKLQEQYLAVNYEKDMEKAYGTKKAAKDHILELYLNTINLGNNLNGVQTASKYYFNKDAKDLTISESAVIAAITQFPLKYQPVLHPDENKKREQVVIKYMHNQGYITDDEYTEAINDPVYDRIVANNQATATVATKNSYYTDQVISDVSKDLQAKLKITSKEADRMVYNGGLKIMIPIDQQIQGIVDKAYLDDSNFPAAEYKIQVTYVLDYKNSITGKTNHVEKTGYVKNKDAIAGYTESVKSGVMGANDEVIDETTYPIVQPQSSFVVIDNATGYVVAIEGGRGPKYTNLGLNRATQSKRQPGSTFKILSTYAPGIDLKKITPATVIDDAPGKIGGATFKNWYGGYHGLTTVREGIWNSVNILAVKTMNMVGVDNCFDYLLNFGFTTLVDKPVTINGKQYSDRNLSTALGGLTYGVTNLELTAAYASIANGGEYRKPVFYTKVYAHDGSLLLDNTNMPSKEVIRPTTAWLLTSMMEDVVNIGTGTPAQFKKLKMPIAGKTGTTTDEKDLMFEGFTPYYTAGIWLGDDTPQALKDGAEQKKIWSKIMEQVHTDKSLPYKDFVQPSGITTATVCMDSGELPGPYCSDDPRGSRLHTEYFETGTVPTESCTVHRQIQVDTSTNMLAGPYCPAALVETITGIVRPSGIVEGDNVRDSKYQLPNISEVCNIHTGPLQEGVNYYVDPVSGQMIYLTPDGVPIMPSGTGISGSGSPFDRPVVIIPSNLPTVVPSPVPSPSPTINLYPMASPTATTNLYPIPSPKPSPSPTPAPKQTPIPTPSKPPVSQVPEFSAPVVDNGNF